MRGVAEAPGKVIISGEHFVVHGATAIAAAIAKKVRVEATRGDHLSIESNLGHAEQLAPARKLLESLYKSKGSRPRVSISITSELADGAGLGSSAATMVAIAGAASALEGWIIEPAVLSNAAGVGEKLVHGNPSGIDVTTSAFGGVLLFKRGEEQRPVTVRNPVTLLVAFSGKKRNTGVLIQKVSEMKETYPALFATLCESATLVSNLCAEALTQGDIATVGRLMTYNHAVLAHAGASNKHLDQLVDTCLRLGCLGAKLTGAGGGGSVLAVPPLDDGEAQSIAEKLRKNGYDAFFTKIPVGGAIAWKE